MGRLLEGTVSKKGPGNAACLGQLSEGGGPRLSSNRACMGERRRKPDRSLREAPTALLSTSWHVLKEGGGGKGRRPRTSERKETRNGRW